VSGPFYSLLLPVFTARATVERSAQRLFDLATRGVALVTMPTAAVFFAVFPALSAVVLPPGYETMQDYVSILVPCFALEVVLSGPAAALMLALPRLAGPYAAIKAVTLAAAAFYFVTAGVDLLLVTAVMMLIRVSSAVALHAAIWRLTGLHIDLGWLGRVVAVSVLVGGLGVAIGFVLPGHTLDLVFIPAAVLAAYFLLVRVVGLLRSSDIEIARAVVPIGGRAVHVLSRS
jgi:hypothetical protein